MVSFSSSHKLSPSHLLITEAFVSSSIPGWENSLGFRVKKLLECEGLSSLPLLWLTASAQPDFSDFDLTLWSRSLDYYLGWGEILCCLEAFCHTVNWTGQLQGSSAGSSPWKLKVGTISIQHCINTVLLRIYIDVHFQGIALWLVQLWSTLKCSHPLQNTSCFFSNPWKTPTITHSHTCLLGEHIRLLSFCLHVPDPMFILALLPALCIVITNSNLSIFPRTF